MTTRTKAAEAAPRGGGAKAKPQVGRLVAQLLTGERTSRLSFADIAERVRRRIPEAQTTARSVASVAHHLRAAGQPIPDRRAREHLRG